MKQDKPLFEFKRIHAKIERLIHKANGHKNQM